MPSDPKGCWERALAKHAVGGGLCFQNVPRPETACRPEAGRGCSPRSEPAFRMPGGTCAPGRLDGLWVGEKGFLREGHP